MEHLVAHCPAAELVAQSLREERFTLVDVGCSGGIDQAWRVFGDRLRAVGFDPAVAECERLNANETLSDVRFVAAFVGVPVDHAIQQRRGDASWFGRNHWPRLSVNATLQERATQIARTDEAERLRMNLWNTVTLADPNTPVYLPDFFAREGFDDIDVLKIDVDGPDFDILQSVEVDLAARRVLAVGAEVNFIGCGNDTEHSFHNTDRLMRRAGFDLVGLTVRPYSMRALPAPYALPIPAQTRSGRPLQGDALYVRDLLADEFRGLGRSWSTEKLAKLVAIYALFGLPDCAAEVVVAERERLGTILDPDVVLDRLAAQAQPGRETPWTYADYMAAFAREDPFFYPSPQLTAAAAEPTEEPPAINRRSLGERLRRAAGRLAGRG